MKKLILLVTVGVFLCVNAFGQIHKAMGDKPLFSHKYVSDDEDIIPETKTIYTYNVNQQLIKETILPFYYEGEGDEDEIDSIVKTYDGNDRILSSINYNYYSNGEIRYEEKWVYDELNKRIDYYVLLDYSIEEEGTFSDTIFYILYEGVNNFNKSPASFLPYMLEMSFVDVSLDIMIDCDSILVKLKEDSWEVFEKIYPIYQNGKPVSAKVVMKDFDVSAFGAPQGIVVDVTIDAIYTYNGDKLMNINGTMTLSNLPLPIPIPPIPDAVVVTNQYDANDLLIETKTEINISIPMMGDPVYMGTKQIYAYNSENNISLLTQEESDDGTEWEMLEKTYYFYDADNVEDIELISIEEPSEWIDNVGELVNIEVYLENKNHLAIYQNINITALITNSQGNTIETITEIIPEIYLASYKTYTFTQSYTVADDSIYFITVYIDSYDNDASNDTIHLIATKENGVNIKPINNKTTVYLSQNIPNPANDNTLIAYSLPANGKVTFLVYSINGQLLSSQSVEATTGENTLELKTDNLSAGIYFYAMEFNGQRIVKKMSISR